MYVAEEDIYVSQKLGLFDQDTVDLQNALLGKKYEEEINVTINKDTGEKTPNNPELISMYNKVILDSSTSSAQFYIDGSTVGSAINFKPFV